VAREFYGVPLSLVGPRHVSPETALTGRWRVKTVREHCARILPRFAQPLRASFCVALAIRRFEATSAELLTCLFSRIYGGRCRD